MQLLLPILCETQKKQQTVETQTLVDSGAGGDFLHEKICQETPNRPSSVGPTCIPMECRWNPEHSRKDDLLCPHRHYIRRQETTNKAFSQT